MDFYQRALLVDPRHIGSLHHLGLIALRIGRAEIAVDMIGRALALNERNAVLHHDLCFALSALDRHAEAVRHARRAIDLKPDYANAHLLLGDAYLKLRQRDEAIAAYRHGLALDPDNAEGHNNLAEALFAQGALDDAASCFEAALRRKPELVTACGNLATIHFLNGDAAQALDVLMRGLRIAETPLLKTLFAAYVRHTKTLPDSTALRQYMVRAISEPWGRPGALAAACTRLIKGDPDIKQLIDRATSAWPTRLSCDRLFGAQGLGVAAGNPLLQALLQNTHVNDVALERFLTLARSVLLDAATAAADNPEPALLAFSCMLARQCFINEYVFAVAADETAKVAALREQVSDALRHGERLAAWPLALIAAYEPLHSIAGFEALLARSWPPEVDDLLTQQLREPMAERALRSRIARLTPIDDDVSLLVQNQYEESPYPRWVKCALDATARPIDEVLRSDFPQARIRPLGRSAGIDVLIAGCGTGQQVVMTARRYAGARILAVDLSLASLCYAKRHTDALGLDNIEYGQADILKLATLGRRFDVIACSGVLHHLADPIAGWRVLLSILRPNGIMQIALYSKTARADVEAARSFIAARGFRASADDIRRCRQAILGLDDTAPAKAIVARSDFFTVSNCRDLLFHVQEHPFTLAQIRDFLDDNGLALLGFQHDAEVLLRYRSEFPDDPACTDFDRWQVYERQHPRTFAAMYQFTVQKQA